jgi:hypothetical protein
MVRNPWWLLMPNTLSMEQEIRQIVLPIVMQNFKKYRGKEANNLAIYECADQLVQTLCKKLSTQSQSDQV